MEKYKLRTGITAHRFDPENPPDCVERNEEFGGYFIRTVDDTELVGAGEVIVKLADGRFIVMFNEEFDAMFKLAE
jgi:hypothetical protein